MAGRSFLHMYVADVAQNISHTNGGIGSSKQLELDMKPLGGNNKRKKYNPSGGGGGS